MRNSLRSVSRAIAQGLDAVVYCSGGPVVPPNSATLCASHRTGACLLQAHRVIPSSPGLRAFAASAAGPPPKHVIHVEDEEGLKDVLQLARATPVILYCSAVWCGPCKKLGPIMDRVVGEADGRVVLAKFDVDNPKHAPLLEKLEVSSVPVMFSLFNGDLLDRRVGLMSEADARDWVKKLEALSKGSAADFEDAQSPQRGAGAQAGAAADQGGEEAKGGEPQIPKDPLVAAEQGLQVAMGIHWGLPLPELGARVRLGASLLASALQSPALDATLKARVTAGLARIAALDPAQDTLAEAKELADQAVSLSPPTAQGGMPFEVTSAHAVVDLVQRCRGLEGFDPQEDPQARIPGLQGALKANFSPEVAYELALRLFVVGRCEEAIDTALLLIRKSREWNGQAGKVVLLKFFECLGAEHPLSKSGKKRLSAIWFV